MTFFVMGKSFVFTCNGIFNVTFNVIANTTFKVIIRITLAITLIFCLSQKNLEASEVAFSGSRISKLTQKLSLEAPDSALPDLISSEWASQNLAIPNLVASNLVTSTLVISNLEVPASESSTPFRNNPLLVHLLSSHESYFNSQKPFYKSRGAAGSLSRMGLGGEYRRQKGSRKTDIAGSLFYSVEEETTYLDLTQAYIQWSLGRAALVAMGRRTHGWSLADELMGRGLWQPRFRWDKLRPRSQGLTGLFLDYSLNDHWNVNLLASPFYTPDTLAKFQVSEGRFQSNNPWFRPPSQSVELFGRETAIHYSFERPEAGDVLFKNPGAAAQLSYKKNITSTTQWFGQLGIAYKPMNQVLLHAPIDLPLGSSGVSPVVQATVRAEVEAHRLLTAEAGVIDGSWKFWCSFMYEDPEVSLLSDDIISQQTVPAQIFTFYVGKKLFSSTSFLLPGRGLEIYGAYSLVSGGNADDRGELADIRKRSYFEKRYQYTNSVQVGVVYPVFPFLGAQSALDISGLYDFDQQGGAFRFRYQVQAVRQVFVSLGFDLVGLMGRDRGVGGFISQYRANDRFHAGVSYGF